MEDINNICVLIEKNSSELQSTLKKLSKDTSFKVINTLCKNNNKEDLIKAFNNGLKIPKSFVEFMQYSNNFDEEIEQIIFEYYEHQSLVFYSKIYVVFLLIIILVGFIMWT